MQKKYLKWTGAMLAVVGMGIATSVLVRQPRPSMSDDIDAAIAPPVQVVMALGDRFFAANFNTLRVTVLDVVHLPVASMPVLGQVQKDIAFLNPCQEDNYYQAQAFLPWSGEMPAAQYVLEQAFSCRDWDVMPGFFLGFNAFYFSGDYQKSGDWFSRAAQRVQGQQRDQLNFLAAKFYEKQDNPQLAIRVIQNLIAGTRNEQLKRFLQGRIIRLEGLVVLRDAARRYQDKYGRKPVLLEDLISSRLLKEIPQDPFGIGYVLDGNGIPVVKTGPNKK